MFVMAVSVSLHVLGAQGLGSGGVSQQVRDDAVVSRVGVCSVKSARVSENVADERPCVSDPPLR